MSKVNFHPILFIQSQNSVNKVMCQESKSKQVLCQWRDKRAVDKRDVTSSYCKPIFADLYFSSFLLLYETSIFFYAKKIIVLWKKQLWGNIHSFITYSHLNGRHLEKRKLPLTRFLDIWTRKVCTNFVKIRLQVVFIPIVRINHSIQTLQKLLKFQSFD